MKLVEGARGRTAAIAVMVGLLAFGVYGLVTPPGFDGYENETAAVAEGITRGQGAKIPLDTELFDVDPDSRTGRTGILQPVLMVPFYAAGAALDSVGSDGDDYTYRSFLLRLYGAFVTALCAAILFLLVRVLGRSEGWALAIALLFAFASIALPYAGIGMEPTGTLVVMLAFLAAAHAAGTGNPWSWASTGVAIGLAASTRPSNVVPALGALVLLWPRLHSADAPERRRLLSALVIPLALAGAAFLAYNLDRTGDPFETTYGSVHYDLGAVPSAAAGLLLSPGKGLAWYSPLAILGVLGLFAMWRRERTLAIAIIAGVALGAAPYLVDFWSDETLGPRYLVPVAWLLLLPIAWWATTHRRRLVVAGVAAVAVWIQLTGTLINYRAEVGAVVSGYTGAHVYGQIFNIPGEEIPYGDDSVRWIPELSPLLFNTQALLSVGARNVGLPGIESHYAPFRGREGSVDASDAPVDVWWNSGTPIDPDIPRPSDLWLLPFALLALGSAVGLWRLGAWRGDPAT